jgi:hypothetical protein
MKRNELIVRYFGGGAEENQPLEFEDVTVLMLRLNAVDPTFKFGFFCTVFFFFFFFFDGIGQREDRNG